jgi:hypothetical protein
MIGVAESGDDPLGRERLLAEIGLGEEVFDASLARGLGGRARATPFHPKSAPGLFMWLETVAALGEIAAPLGWDRSDYLGFATIVRKDGRYAIAVASGSDGTGDLRTPVTTRSPKGVATNQAVKQNLNLPYDDTSIAENKQIAARAGADVETWFLLHDIRGGILYSELSRPMSISEGYVARWVPRIVLTARPVDPVQLPMDGGEPPVNPNVPVKRRDPA